MIWLHQGRSQQVVMELKVLHKTLERTIADGLGQRAEYMGRCGAKEGHLVIFDRSRARVEQGDLPAH